MRQEAESITVAAPLSSSGTVAAGPVAEAAAPTAALLLEPSPLPPRSDLSAADVEAGMTCNRAAAGAELQNFTTQCK